MKSSDKLRDFKEFTLWLCCVCHHFLGSVAQSHLVQ